VTLDDASLRELSSLSDSLPGWKAAVDRALDSSMLEASSAFFEQLAGSLDDLGDDPSASAVIREAVQYFFVAIKRAERIALMERGYEALAREPEREAAIRSVTARAAERSAEP